MSASSKKKLRKELESQKLTEKQQQAQKEAKKLKITTIGFAALLVAIVLAFAVIITVNGIKTSGVIEKNTVAATVGGHELNSIEFNYYYNDAVSNTYNNWSESYGDYMATYLALMGLDLTAPLSEQAYLGDESMTWADYFVDYALERAQSDYALYDAAQAAGFSLSEEELTDVTNNILTLGMYAQLYGYTDLEHYLTATYGAGASEKTYTEYCTISATATAYYNAYGTGLNFDDTAISEYDNEDPTLYNSYNYAYYYINASWFLHEDLEEGEEHDHSEHTAEETAAAAAKAKEAADSLRNVKDIEELNAAIAALALNESSTAATTMTDAMGTSLSSIYKTWLTSGSREENDVQVFAYESTSTDDDGNETTVINGYYVVMFQSVNTNERPVGNVRHLLVAFEEDEDGNVTAKAMEEAKAAADGYLKTWQEGEATEESFIELVKAHSDDSTASTGGLFEDITPASSYVESFLNWSINENRQVGDAEVIESEYGYHVMYYVGASELNYREMMIESDMISEALNDWYTNILEGVDAQLGDTKHVNTDLILSAS